jgi:hypothetical protein
MRTLSILLLAGTCAGAACAGTHGSSVANSDGGTSPPDASQGAGGGPGIGADDAGSNGTVPATDAQAEDASVGPVDASGPSDASSSPPLALVYRGAASCSASGGGCSEAWAAMFQSCQPGFQVAFVGPKETLPLTQAVLATATVYVQPGGNENLNGSGGDWALILKELDPAWIRDFVGKGGRYLGSCTGGYMAGTNPWAGPNIGYDMIQSSTAEYVTSPDASPTTPNDTVVTVVWQDVWGKAPTPMYFQDGPFFSVNAGASQVQVLATYQSNGEVAALVAAYGKGKVGVEGPHAEAPADWYSYNSVPGSPNFAPGCDLIAKTLAP